MNTPAWNDAMDFWNSSTRRKDQHFYTGFTILVTTLQSILDSKKLSTDYFSEWSITTFYYALMHSCRLPLFLTTGDFPRSHSRLPEFMIGTREETRFDWMAKSLGERDYSNKIIARNDIIARLESLDDSTDWNSFLCRKGKVLHKMKEARESVNYEGLVTAHRGLPPLLTHKKVSKALLELLEICNALTWEIVQDSIEVFKNHINAFDENDRWKSFLHWNPQKHDKIEYNENGALSEDFHYEGIAFLRNALKAPRGHKKTKRLLQKAIRLLEYPHIHDEGIKSNQVFGNISIDMFHEKTAQMDDLRRIINELREVYDFNEQRNG